MVANIVINAVLTFSVNADLGSTNQRLNVQLNTPKFAFDTLL